MWRKPFELLQKGLVCRAVIQPLVVMVDMLFMTTMSCVKQINKPSASINVATISADAAKDKTRYAKCASFVDKSGIQIKLQCSFYVHSATVKGTQYRHNSVYKKYVHSVYGNKLGYSSGQRLNGSAHGVISFSMLIN